VKNIQKQIDNENSILKKLTPWKLKNMNVQRVQFEENEWKETDAKIKEFWNQVEEFKLHPPVDPVAKKIKFIDDDE